MASYNLGTASGRIVVDGSGAERGFAVARAAADSFVRSVSDQTAKIESMGKKLTAASAAGVVGFGLAVNAASKFENRLSAIQAVSGATEDEMDKISDAALRIGAQTSFGATEAALAFEELIKAGVSVDDALNGAADSAVAMAEAGEIDLARAAEIAAAAMNNFNMEASDLGSVADTVAGAANASAIGVEDFAQSMNQAGAVANLTGLSFDDMAIAIAEMGNAGIKGSDAGTSLKTMLMNLIPTTKRQITEFERLGLLTFNADQAMQAMNKNGIKPLGKSHEAITDSIKKHLIETEGLKDGTAKLEEEAQKWLMTNGGMQNAFFDSEGKIQSLRNIQDTLADSTAGMTDEQKLASLELLFGADAIRAVSIMANEGADGYDKMSEAMSSVTAADVAAKRMDNLSGAIEEFQGAIETISIRIGQLLIPGLTWIVRTATKVVDAVANASDTVYKWVTGIGVAGTAIGGFVGGLILLVSQIGPLLALLVGAWKAFTLFKGLGTIVAAFRGATTIVGGLGAAFSTAAAMVVPFWTILKRIPSILTKIPGVITLISGALRIMGSALAFATGPVGIIIGVLGALVGAFIWAYQNIEPFRTTVDNLVGTLMTALAPAIDTVKQVLGTLADVFTSVMDTIATGNVNGVLNDVFGIDESHPAIGFLQSVHDGIQNLIGVAQTAGGSIGTAFTDGLSQIAGVWTTSVWPALQGLADVFVNQLMPALAEAGGMIMSALIPGLTQIWQAVGPILPVIMELATTVGGLLIGAFMTLVNVLTTMIIPTIIEVAGPIITMLVTALMQIASFIVSNILPPLIQLATFLISLLGPAIQFLASVFQAVFPIIVAIVEGVVNNVIGALQGLVTFFQGIITIFQGIFSGDWAMIWEGVKQVFMGVVQFLWNAIQLWFVGKILGILRSVMGFILGIFRSGWSLVTNLFSTVIGFIGGLVRTGFGLVRTVIQTVMSAIRSVITWVWNAIRGVFTTAVNTVRNTVSNGFNAVRNAVNTVMNGIRSIISAVWNAIASVFNSVIARLRGFVTVGFNSMKSSATSIMNGLKSGVQGVWNSVLGFFRGIPGKIKGVFSGAGRWLADAGRKIIDGLWNGLKSAWKGVTGWFSDITANIPKLKGPEAVDRKLLVGNGELIMKGLRRGLENELGPVYDILTGLTRDIPMRVTTQMSTPQINAAMLAGMPVMQHHIVADKSSEGDGFDDRPIYLTVNGVDTDNAEKTAGEIMKELKRVRRAPGAYAGTAV